MWGWVKINSQVYHHHASRVQNHSCHIRFLGYSYLSVAIFSYHCLQEVVYMELWFSAQSSMVDPFCWPLTFLKLIDRYIHKLCLTHIIRVVRVWGTIRVVRVWGIIRVVRARVNIRAVRICAIIRVVFDWDITRVVRVWGITRVVRD